VVDTTGAGDTFVGVLAAELTAGADIDSAVQLACRAASHSVTRHGVIDGIPHRAGLLGEAA
jgi:ribokinase